MRLARFRLTSGERGFGIVDGDAVVRVDHRIASFEAMLTEPPAPDVDDPRIPANGLAITVRRAFLSVARLRRSTALVAPPMRSLNAPRTPPTLADCAFDRASRASNR